MSFVPLMQKTSLKEMIGLLREALKKENCVIEYKFPTFSRAVTTDSDKSSNPF